MEYKTNNYILACSLTISENKKVAFINFSLNELNACLMIENEIIKKLNLFHSSLYFPSTTRIEIIKSVVKSWLSNYDNELAAKSSQYIDEFMSDESNFVIDNNVAERYNKEIN
jgi:hypothetical protein